MPFFELPNEPEDGGDDFYDDSDATTAYVGRPATVAVIIARAEDAAVALTRVVAFHDGFEFTITWFLRGEALKRSRRLSSSFLPMPSAHGRSVSGGFLRVGVQFPDGKKATNLVDAWTAEAPTTDHGLMEAGGSGGDRSFEQQFWAWPLPGKGFLKFVVEWPDFGIAETELMVDGAAITELGGLTEPVWQDEPDGPSHHLGFFRL